MKKLFSFVFRYSPVLLIAATFAGVITGLANTILIGLINKGLDQNNASASIIWSFAAICLLLPISRVVSQVLLTSLMQTAVFDLRMGLSRQILSSPLRRLEEQGPNRVLASLTTDVTSIGNALNGFPFMCMNVTIIVSCMAYLYYLYWPAGLAVSAGMIVGAGIYMWVNKIASWHLYQARLQDDALFKHFGAVTGGAKEFKINDLRRQDFLSNTLKNTAQTARRGNIYGSVWFGVAGSLGQFIFFGIMGALVFTLPSITPGLPPEVLRGYAMVLLYIALPLDSITQSIPMYRWALVALDKIEGLGLELQGDTSLPQSQQESQTNMLQDWNQLVYRDITYTYQIEEESKAFSLGPIHLEFKPGELVFLTGGNGSGKTSLAKIILGLYQADSGSIEVDGRRIEPQEIDQFRQSFGAIFSDFYLFQDIVGFEQPGINEKAVDYLKRLQLNHKVTIQDGHYSTIELSTGQRKRLALLTAYLEDRPIYLFDEWAADQDPYFKEIFYRTLLPELKARGKTVFVISHDDHYYHTADRIIKLNYGMIESDMVGSSYKCEFIESAIS